MDIEHESDNIVPVSLFLLSLDFQIFLTSVPGLSYSAGKSPIQTDLHRQIGRAHV